MPRRAPAPPSESPCSADDGEPWPRRFVPVPRASQRADGWTADRQYAFVAALARLPSVAAAARSVGMRANSAHRLRRARGAEDFALAWDEAIEIGLSEARGAAVERALVGEVVAIRRRGVVVGSEVRRDDRLLLAALNSFRGEMTGRLNHQRSLARRREEAIYGKRYFEPSHADYLADRTAVEIARDERIDAAAAPHLDEAARRDARIARFAGGAGLRIRRL